MSPFFGTPFITCQTQYLSIFCTKRRSENYSAVFHENSQIIIDSKRTNSTVIISANAEFPKNSVTRSDCHAYLLTSPQ